MRRQTSTNLAHNASQQQQLNRLVGLYLDNAMSTKDEYELEVRFGTRGIKGIKPIMRRDHERVIEKLLSDGYACTRTDDYHLRIQCVPEPPNPKVSNIRVEINGRANIQEYCNTNTLNPDQTGFNKKTGVYVNDTIVPHINFDDFNFRVSLQKEHRMRYESAEIRSLSAESEWSKVRKTFRYINRTSFEHPDLPLRIDMSVIKESHRKEGSWQMEAEYNFATSKVTESALKYEIEIEVLNARVGPGKFINSAPVLANALRGAIKLVLSGLQGTNFPISYPEMQTVYNEYYHLLHYNDARDRRGGGGGGGGTESQFGGGDRGDRDRDRDAVRLFPSDFIGPSSVTLQKFNLADIDIAGYDESSKPNIRFNYTVTEKADGQRKMLFVNRMGRMYLIDTAMNVQFTGAVCIDDKLHYTLIDGEHILHDKAGKFINLYAAFDIYYIHKIDIRHLAFATNNRTSAESNFRLYHLREFMRDSSATFRSVVPATGTGTGSGGTNKAVAGAFLAAPIRLTVKRFEVAGNNGGPYDIFHCCSNVLNWINDGCFEYHTDGLIFTPANTGVCASKIGGHAPLKKMTWPRSFKWKPVEHNTIDFMVTTEKHHDQSDVVKKSYANGEIIEYKTLTLRVGYSVERDGYLNPMSTAIDLPNEAGGESLFDVTAFADPDAATGAAAAAATGAAAAGKYNKQTNQVAAPFYPTMPPDDTAHICNIRLRNSGGIYQMLTESGDDSFGDRSVVEFRYDMDRDAGWRWVPIKVRHDKTLAKEMGNAFHVANDNWFSIHNPLTTEMIRTGANILSEGVVESDAYYNRSPVIRDGDRLRDTTSMQPLRDFHNLFVKRALISAVCRPGSTLIDLAVGKAGDIHKWAHAELSVVFGIDISEDNIRNRQDGAYARYLTLRKNNLMKSLPYMAFIRADSGKPIRASETEAYESGRGGRGGVDNSSLYKAIADTMFGAVERPDPAVVGRAVAQHYAVGKDGFDVCSVQFALHYFWRDVPTLHTFLRNVSETTKVGGHFIGTCYDGKRVYKMLLTERIDDPLSVYDDACRCVWSITRQYAYDKRDKMGGAGGYLDDETCVGYAIDVFQESINKTHREYLVNMVYFTRLMENYGFVLVPKAEAEQEYRLPNSMGSFEELFRLMKSEISSSSSSGGKHHDYWLAPEMNDSYHSTVSFLNNYFIFKKERQVDAKSISEAFIKNRGLREALQEHLSASVSDVVVAPPPAVAAAEVNPGVKAKPKPKPKPKPNPNPNPNPAAADEQQPAEAVEVEGVVDVAKKRKYTRKAKPSDAPAPASE